MVDYLISVDYKTCKHKDLLLLLLTTGMRVGELTKLNISDMQITNINDILKIKSAFFINEYYKNECSKIVQKRPGSKIKFKEEFYKECIDKLYSRLFIEKFESNESSFTDSADEDWTEFLYKHKDIGTAYIRFLLRNSGKDLENI